MRIVVAFIGAALGAWFLTHVALKVGWIDQRSGQEYRKPERHPVALVGGAVILLAVLLALVLVAIDSYFPLRSFMGDVRGMALPGLLGAFALGLLDDIMPGGLSAPLKFAGQLLVAALVALFPGSIFVDASALECMGLAALALIAMNAVNLFDHADGLAGLLCTMAMAAGKAPLAPVFAAAAAGYLPFNLFFRRGGRGTSGAVGEEPSHSAPFAMLGDSGSHLVGVLLATTPGAWWFLLLPLLDMVRVTVKRSARGAPFWRGDRTHLGHLLHGIGFSPVTTTLLVGTLLLPPLVTVTLMDGPGPLVAGLLATAALYFGMLVMVDHAMGEGALSEANWRDHELDGAPRSSQAEPSVSDVFARASGVEDEPHRPGSDKYTARDPALDHDQSPPGPFAGPSAAEDDPSGPFAGPSPDSPEP